MKTLFIPDIINIEINDEKGKPLQQSSILFGIQTFATHKNDIDIYPFLTDKEGHLTITKAQVEERANNYISYGIMDYTSVEYAKPYIEIYYWGNEKLEHCIDYWSKLLKEKRNRKQTEHEIKLLDNLQQEFAEIEKREAEELAIFSSSFNRKRKQKENIVIVKDTWDKQVEEVRYKVNLHL